MIKYENECVDCGKPCLGNLCPKRNVKHYYCDCCHHELDSEEGMMYESKLLCSSCLAKALIKDGIIENWKDE